MDDCRFCRIASGERDAYVLSADDLATAFLDANPARDGHVLVVPNSHVEDLLLLDEETLTAVARTARSVATALSDVLEPDGFSVVHTTGGLVGTVEHAHLHVLPRDVDDDITLSLTRNELADDEARRLVDAVGRRL